MRRCSPAALLPLMLAAMRAGLGIRTIFLPFAIPHLGRAASLHRPHRALELAHGMQLTHFVGMVLKLASHAVSLCSAGFPRKAPAEVTPSASCCVLQIDQCEECWGGVHAKVIVLSDAAGRPAAGGAAGDAAGVAHGDGRRVVRRPGAGTAAAGGAAGLQLHTALRCGGVSLKWSIGAGLTSSDVSLDCRHHHLHPS